MDEREKGLSARAIAALRNCQDSRDIEKAHSVADEILAGLLTSLGFEEVVKEYDKIEKWCA